MLALAHAAQSEVVITKKTIPIPLGIAGVGLDLNHDGVTDFRFYGTYASFSGTSFRVAGGGVVGSFYASALARGTKIGPAALFSSGTFERIEIARGGYLHHKFYGKWGNNQKNRYLGVRFKINGETHYGWIRLTVTIPPNPRFFMTGTIIAYAYETLPNTPIVAGTAEKPSVEAQVLNNVENRGGPSLGMLALGAQGLPLWRREEALLSN